VRRKKMGKYSHIQVSRTVDYSVIPEINPNIPPSIGISSIGSQMRVSNNTIWGTMTGMKIADADLGTVVRDNKFYRADAVNGAGRGIDLSNASIRIEWNTFDGIDTGIYCGRNSSAIIANNRI
jgi:nitrous oxidase accessory protein NosD